MTTEQEELANSNDEVAKGEACAGSGKTYTAKKYIEKNINDKILYMCFQRAMVDEAKEKFKDFKNVHVKTFHQLAWHSYGQTYSDLGKISTHSLSAADIRNKLGLYKDSGIKVSEYALLLLNAFVSSSKKTIEDTKEFEELCENESDILLTNNALLAATTLYNRMIDTSDDMPITHDIYLKLYQMDTSEKRLKYDRIIIDEAQDITERDLSIFSRRIKKDHILYIGDSHQQIFGWRGAVNSLRLVKGERYTLSATFRNGPEIAELSNYMLNKFKFANSNIEGLNEKQIVIHELPSDVPHAIISRTNQSIVKNAITAAIENKKMLFIGGIEKYSIDFIKDMYYFKKKGTTNNFLLSKYNSYSEIMEYLEESPNPDAKLKSSISIVETYKDELPNLLNKIEKMTTKDVNEANIYLTNVHQAKGLEFDYLKIDDDFIKWNKYFMYYSIAKKNNDYGAIAKLEEEINAWYVAISRAKGPTQLSKSLISLQEKMYEEAEEKIYKRNRGEAT